MSASERTDAPIAVALDRLIRLLLMLMILAAILTVAMVMQYAFGEIPCPLCLLQRFAMFGCCFGFVQQLRSGSSELGTGISLIFSILLLVISVRWISSLAPVTNMSAARYSASICRFGPFSLPWGYCLASQSGSH